MEVQIHSDLHLNDINNITFIKPIYDTLILAGDITNIEDPMCFQFFNYVNKNWKKTFIVLGNHEYYSHNQISYYNLKELYKAFFIMFNNIELLDKKAVKYKGRKIIGCTLWSPGNKENINVGVLKHIHNSNNERISYNFYRNLFKKEKKWLLDNIEDGTIVITHYPTFSDGSSHPKYDNDPVKSRDYICSDILHTIKKTHCVFISGHSHFNYDYLDKTHRLIANQKGTIDENIENYNKLGLWEL